MNPKLKLILLIAIFSLGNPVYMKAQGSPPTDDPEINDDFPPTDDPPIDDDNPPTDDPPIEAAPIDDGLALLLIAGILFAGKIYYQRYRPRLYKNKNIT